MAEKKKLAFGGKLIDLKASKLKDVTLEQLFKDKYPDLKVPPTAITGAIWQALYKAQYFKKQRFFGTKKEIGEKLEKKEMKEIFEKIDGSIKKAEKWVKKCLKKSKKNEDDE